IEKKSADGPRPRNRNQRHHDPISDQERGDDRGLLSFRRAQRKQRSSHVRDSDPLQYARESKMLRAIENALQKSRMVDAGDFPPPEKRKSVQEQADEHDHQTSANDLPDHLLRRTLPQREMRRDADDEEKERK